MPRPDFINYFEDRDLWRKALPGGGEFTQHHQHDAAKAARPIVGGVDGSAHPGLTAHRADLAQALVETADGVEAEQQGQAETIHQVGGIGALRTLQRGSRSFTIRDANGPVGTSSPPATDALD